MPLVDSSGRPLNNKPELVLPDSAKKNVDPRVAVSRMMRRLESALRAPGQKHLVGTIQAYAQQGWNISIDENVQTRKCEIMLTTHMRMDIHGQLEISAPVRVIRLGTAFLPAVKYLHELYHEPDATADPQLLAEEKLQLEKDVEEVRKEIASDPDTDDTQDSLSPESA